MPKLSLWTLAPAMLTTFAARAEPDPALYLAPPSDAVILFDGTSGEAFRTQVGAPVQVKNAVLAIEPGSVDLASRDSYGFGQYHLELERPPDAIPTLGVCGASGIPLGAVPGPGGWESVDLFCQPAQPGKDGRPGTPARLSLVINGSWVGDVRPLGDSPPPAPLRLEDKGVAVRFRNIWFRPFESQRSEHEPVLLPPPAGAEVLLGPDGPVGLTSGGNRPFQWLIEGAEIEIKPGGGSVYSKQAYRDFQLHLEFRPPAKSQGSGQSDGNSGLYIHNLYEVQILNSYEDKTPQKSGCGSLYRVQPPLTNACRPRGEWQSYDILFRAAVVDDGGKVLQNARLSVRQNGIWIHDDLEVPGPTGSAAKRPQVSEAPFQLQNHGNAVRFRNIWIRQLPVKAQPDAEPDR